MTIIKVVNKPTVREREKDDFPFDNCSLYRLELIH